MQERLGAVLADLVRRSEIVKANVITPKEDVIANHQDTPLLEHMEAWLAHLEAKGVTPGRVKTNRQRFTQVARDCGFTRLSDLDGAGLEGWMVEKRKEGMSAGSRNGYREACVGFANCAVRTKRLGENPFAYVPKADAKADCRRRRRALTEDELVRLLDATGRRPLLEAMTVRRGKDKGKPLGKVKPRTCERLERLGRERALIYKTLVLTGLRRNELASITVGQVALDGPFPHLILHPADEKNRQGSDIPLRADLIDDIRTWLDGKLLVMQKEAIRRGEEAGETLLADTPLFVVPAGLGKGFGPGPEAGRDPEDRQPRLDRRRARVTAYLRHALEQGQRSPPRCPGRDAPLDHRPDDERLHGSAVARRGGGAGSAAGAVAAITRRAGRSCTPATGVTSTPSATPLAPTSPPPASIPAQPWRPCATAASN